MQLDKFHKEAQQALITGQDIAQKNHCQAYEPEHLALALVTTPELKQLLRKKNVEYKSIESSLLILLSRLPVAPNTKTPFSGRLVQVLSAAEAFSIAKAHEKILVSDLFSSMLEHKDQLGALGSVLAKYFLSSDKLVLSAQESEEKLDPSSILFKVSDNINEQIKLNKLETVFERQQECSRVIQVLSRKSRNNPILIGQPGCGRTSIIYGLAHKIIKKDIPSHLVGKQILSLNIGSLVAGTTLRGQFEERVTNLLKDLKGQKGQYILLVRDLSQLMGAGGEGASNAVSLFKPALEKGEIQMVGLVTPDAYKKNIENDPSFERFFQPIWIDPPSADEAFSILSSVKEKYEQFHGVFIEDGALKAAIDLGSKHLSGGVLPEVALDILDEASSRCRIKIDKVPHEISFEKEQLSAEEIELESYKNKPRKSGEKMRLKEQKIAGMKKRIDLLTKNYEKELSIIESMRAIKNELFQIKLEINRERSLGNVQKVASMESTYAQALHDKLAVRLKELSSIKKTHRLIDPWVKADNIAEIVSEYTGIPVQKMMQSERDKLVNMEELLSSQIIGQKEAIIAVANAIRRGRSGLSDPKKPIGSFLFLGPTGVGKTETARMLTTFLFDDEKAMHRFDMSEFMERHTVARLIGAPPGYQGSSEGGQLTEKVRRRPYSVLLFDEIEKAHVDVLNVLLQVLDDGRLSDSRGNLVNFGNTVIIMTSNIGADLLLQSSDNGNETGNVRSKIMERLLLHLRPEFVNRIDEIVIFNAIARKDIILIADLMIKNVAKRLKSQGLILDVSEQAKAHLADLGYSPEFGARPLKRTIQRLIENPLAMSLVKGEFGSKKTIHVSLDKDNEICFTPHD